MIEFLNNFALAQMLICCLLLLPYRHKGISIVLFVLLMLSCSGYLLSDVYGSKTDNFLLHAIGFLGGNALPGIFWLVSLRIFGDHLELTKKQYFIASSTLLIPLLTVLVITFFPLFPSVEQNIVFFTKKLGLLIELVLVSHALFTSASNWHNDLVQERRFIRGGVISLSALYIFLVIVLEQILMVQSYSLSVIKALGVVALTSAINLILFKPKSSTLFEPKKSKTKLETTNNDNPLFNALIKSMEQEKLFRQDGMTISSLAKVLSTQEYILRNLINQELGYRNFNDFLNKYRIEEISQKIKSDPESNTPFLTLALESGFRSLSSFNKAFKQTHELTPTEYKKKVLTDY